VCVFLRQAIFSDLLRFMSVTLSQPEPDRVLFSPVFCLLYVIHLNLTNVIARVFCDNNYIHLLFTELVATKKDK